MKESVHVDGHHMFPAPFGQHNLQIDLSSLPANKKDMILAFCRTYEEENIVIEQVTKWNRFTSCENYKGDWKIKTPKM